MLKFHLVEKKKKKNIQSAAEFVSAEGINMVSKAKVIGYLVSEASLVQGILLWQRRSLGLPQVVMDSQCIDAHRHGFGGDDSKLFPV